MRISGTTRRSAYSVVILFALAMGGGCGAGEILRNTEGDGGTDAESPRDGGLAALDSNQALPDGMPAPADGGVAPFDGESPDVINAHADAAVDAPPQSDGRPPTDAGNASYGLTVTKAGSGSGTVTSNPAGISCGASCTASFAAGTSVTLTAAASGAASFGGWSGAGCSGTGPCTLAMNAAKSVTATFTQTCGSGPFGPNNWPPACWRPYASNSVWNSRIPPNPRLLSNSALIVTTLVGIGSPFVTQFTYTAPNATPSTHDISHPTFYSTGSDPAYAVVSSSCIKNGNPPFIPLGTVVRIPTAARPAGGSDGHMTVIDQLTNTEFDFYKFPAGGVSGGGNLPSNIGSCSKDDVVSGDGRSSHTTVAHFDNLAGMVRGEELAAGNIDHALFLVAGCVDDSGGVYPSIIAPGGFYQCARNGGGSNVGAPPAGALYWLDYTDAEIAALNIPTWQKTLALALAHYGGYIGDTGGGGSPNMGFRFESGITYSQYGATSPVVGVATAAGISNSGNGYSFNPTGIDWANHLHVLDPCVPRGLTGQPGGCATP